MAILYHAVINTNFNLKNGGGEQNDNNQGSSGYQQRANETGKAS
jgi:hypothetical protein